MAAKKIVWAKRATLRRCGEMLRTVTVPFHIGRNEVAGVIAYASATYGRDTTAATVRKEVEEYLYWHGCPDGSIWDGVSQEDTDRAYALCDKLFPELKGVK